MCAGGIGISSSVSAEGSRVVDGREKLEARRTPRQPDLPGMKRTCCPCTESRPRPAVALLVVHKTHKSTPLAARGQATLSQVVMQWALFFPCVLLSLHYLQGKVRAVQCIGGLTCANNTQCDADNVCECLPGYNGHGRVFCAQDRCVCITLADPRITLFDKPPNQQSMKANLPCSVDLIVRMAGVSAFATDYTNTDGTGCIVRHVVAHPEVRSGGAASDPPFRTFVTNISMSGAVLDPVAFTLTPFTVDVTDDSASISNSGYGTTTSDPDGFERVMLTKCAGMLLGYRETYGSAYVALPKDQSSTLFEGLCGNCNNNTSDEVVGSSAADNLLYYMQNLAPASRQLGPFAGICQNISDEAVSCGATELSNAADVCGRYLLSFGRCVRDDAANTAITDDDSLLSAFAVCVTKACNGDNSAALCSLLNSHLSLVPATERASLPCCSCSCQCFSVRMLWLLLLDY